MGRHDPWDRPENMAGHHEGWQSEVRRSGGEAPEVSRIWVFLDVDVKDDDGG